MKVVAAGAESSREAAVAAAATHASTPPVCISMASTSAAAAIQHTVRHGMTLWKASDAPIAVVCVLTEPDTGVKRSRNAPTTVVYAVLGPPDSDSVDGCNGTHLNDQRQGNGELEADRDGRGVNAKRHG